GIVETAEYVKDGIALTDVPEELVAETFALARPLHQAGDIDDLHRGRQDALWVHQRRGLVQAYIRYRDRTHVGFDGAEGEVGRLCLGIAQTVEQGALAHVGKADD